MVPNCSLTFDGLWIMVITLKILKLPFSNTIMCCKSFYYIALSHFGCPTQKSPHLPSPPGCLYGLYLGFGATTGANFLGGCCVDTEMLGVPKEWVVSIRAGTWPRGSPVLLGGSQDGWDIAGIWNLKETQLFLQRHENGGNILHFIIISS